LVAEAETGRRRRVSGDLRMVARKPRVGDRFSPRERDARAWAVFRNDPSVDAGVIHRQMSSVPARSLNTKARSTDHDLEDHLPSQSDTAKRSANAITAHLAATFADLPVHVYTIEHADGVVLVDTGMIDSTPELDEEGAPVPMPESIPRDVVCVIN